MTRFRNIPRQLLIQQRMSNAVAHLRPHRWAWSDLARPLDRQLARQAQGELVPQQVFNLRYFWLDGLFSAVSESFYLGFVPLLALAYGASSGQVGLLTALANLSGAIALFPGARLVERAGRRKGIVIWSSGGLARLALLGLVTFPIMIQEPEMAIILIIILRMIMAFMGNLANPAWTAMVADLVPDFIRGRYFSSRNLAMGVAALAIAPLAGQIIALGNGWLDQRFLGYQAAFTLAFVFGMVSTFNFSRIKEPLQTSIQATHHHRGDLRRAIKTSPGFPGLVVSAFIWNLALQVAAPFFNIYLVSEFQASTGMIGFLAGVSSLTALFGQRVFGRVLDRKGALWVQQVCGWTIPVLPLAWIFITSPWQVGIINTLGGFVWAGYNLSNFNLLLDLTPASHRPRAVALYQTTVFTSAVLGPLLGGYLIDAAGFRLSFGLSATGRLVGMLVFAWFTVRPAAAFRQDKHAVVEDGPKASL